MKPTLQLVAVAIVVLLGASLATAGGPPMNALQCARLMCDQMRQCSTFVPQPGGQFEKTDKPTNTRSASVNNKNAGTDVQGLNGTCRQVAFWDFEDCTFQGQEGRVKPADVKKTNNTNNTVTPVESTQPKK